MDGHHVVLNIPTGGGKSFPQMAANIFAKGKQRSHPGVMIFSLRHKAKQRNASLCNPFLCSEEGKTACLILPLVALEPQVEAEMTRLGLRYVSLTCSPVESLEEQIRITKPHVLLCNVESLTSPDIQRRISKLKISYIAVDEAQV